MRELYYLSQGELLPQTGRATLSGTESYYLSQGELLSQAGRATRELLLLQAGRIPSQSWKVSVPCEWKWRMKISCFN